MFDSSTYNHAARVLGEISPDLPADAALRRYLRLARRVGPRERRAISRAVFTYFRWLQWLDQRESLQKQLARASEIHDRFTRDPRTTKPETLAARAVPEWLREEMELPPAFLQHLQREPTLWLRARPGSASRLTATLGQCAPASLILSSEFRVSSFEPKTENPKPGTRNPELGTPSASPDRPTSLAPDALHYTGAQDLFLTPAFHAGAFEIQDLASQLVSIAAAPRAKETWWDACAGEGGKTLHLGDLMDNKGLIWATDRSTRRLETLKRRAARAHLFNFRTAVWDGSPRLPTKTKFDGILVDAPCSGVGTWQRNPHARWTTTLDDVRELAALQLGLLNQVAGSLKPGGRLIYSVCTLTRSETSAVVDAFSAAHPELEPSPVFGGLPGRPGAAATEPAAPNPATSGEPPLTSHRSPPNAPLSTSNPQLSAVSSSLSALPSQLFLWPHEINANGMFIAAWKARSR